MWAGQNCGFQALLATHQLSTSGLLQVLNPRGSFDFATSKGGTTITGTPLPAVPTAHGYAYGLRHQRLEWHGGYHAFTLQYGTGAASDFESGTAVPDPTPFVNKSRQLLVTEQVLVQPNDRFAIMPITIFQRYKDGNPQHGWNQWVSFGAGPRIFFTKYVSLAFEGGFDHTDGFIPTQNGDPHLQGWLRKFTIAPQIGAGRKFYSLCRLVERIPGLCGRSALSEQNQRPDVWRADGNVVVGICLNGV
jgi:hypothetical protein